MYHVFLCLLIVFEDFLLMDDSRSILQREVGPTSTFSRTFSTRCSEFGIGAAHLRLCRRWQWRFAMDRSLFSKTRQRFTEDGGDGNGYYCSIDDRQTKVLP